MIKIKGVFGTLTDIDMAEYEAYEIQFHTPSEHKLAGKSYDLELQIHHRPLTEGDFAKKAVLSVLFDKTYGTYNNFFEKLDLVNLPDSYTKDVKMENIIDINSLFED